MQKKHPASGSINTPNLSLEWNEAVWDTVLFGYPVIQIINLNARTLNATNDFKLFESARDIKNSGLVSCRLSHEQLRESMLLESHEFRFIEMVYQPEFDCSKGVGFIENNSLEVRLADAQDLPAILEIAGSAFRSERFYMDYRLNSDLTDKRYCFWVNNSFTDSSTNQQLYVIKDQSHVVAFFIIELQTDGTCYWHLTAVAPRFQGQGYGRKSWQTMLQLAWNQNAKRVKTCIAGRNHRVLNLYVRLGFYFPPPLMTFHWVRPTDQ